MPSKQSDQTDDQHVAKMLARLSQKSRWSKEDATLLIKLFKQSGLSRAGFAKQHGLPPTPIEVLV